MGKIHCESCGLVEVHAETCMFNILMMVEMIARAKKKGDYKFEAALRMDAYALWGRNVANYDAWMQ